MSRIPKLADKVPRRLLKLACGHTVIYKVAPPAVGKPAYCHRCGDWRKVVKP